jgi:hypothetical protein
MVPGLPAGIRWDHGRGGILATEDIPGRAKKGTMFWSGRPKFAIGWSFPLFPHFSVFGGFEHRFLFAVDADKARMGKWIDREVGS